MTQTNWYNAERVSRPGSVVLNAWRAEREAQRVRAETYTPSPDVRRGTEIFEWMSGGMSSAGVAVTEQTAQRVSAVYACINLIGGAIASMPLPVYKRTLDGRERADHDIWWLLNEQPHPSMSAAVMWEYHTSSLLLNGDGYIRILRASRFSNKIVGFEPYHKGRVLTKREHDRLWYHITSEDGLTFDVVDQDDMLHVPGPGFDGLNGKSQIKHALKNPAGIALAADEYSGAFFKNGARPDFAIEVAGAVTPDQQDMLRRTWSDRHGGLTNAHLPALLVGGAKVHELTMNAEDAQLIDTRRFQVEDIARVFGVPPHMIGHTEKTSSWGSGVEQMGIGFVKYTLQRHLVKIEQELNRKIWPSREKYFVEFATAGLERGDYKSRNEGYRIALGRAGEPGWMSVNEVRRFENLPPVADGDTIPKATQEVPGPTKEDTQEAAAKNLADMRTIANDAQKPTIVNVAAPVINLTVPEQASPIVNNTVNIPETVVNVEAVMPGQAAPIVNNTVNVEKQDAAVVNVGAPVINVAPAEVNVTLPARKIVGTVERNAAREIVTTTQIETDL